MYKEGVVSYQKQNYQLSESLLAQGSTPDWTGADLHREGVLLSESGGGWRRRAAG